MAEANRFIADLAGQGIELGADQAAAVRGILTSGAQVETLVGPAGTGKSFVVGAIGQGLARPGSVGRAAAPGGRPGRLPDRHRSPRRRRPGRPQHRPLARHPGPAGRRAPRQGDDPRWRLRRGDLVVVDESAMANTPDLVRIHAHCQQAGAKLLLTGDHHQLAAVGAAGGMELVAATGARHELAETRRFAQPWEGAASLRLRAQDQTVLADYHKHGRLLDGGALEQAETAAARAWLADTLTGRHALLIVDTNEQVARLSAQLRADLVRLGRVDDEQQRAARPARNLGRRRRHRPGPPQRLAPGRLPRQPPRPDQPGAVPGHRRPRRRRPRGHSRSWAARDRVEGERIVLPADYVAEHLALGYASTVHAAQGLTVDTCHTVVTQTTAAEALYVGMTRGRQANTAHVVTRAVPADAPPGTVLEAVHRSPAAVLAGVFETSDPQRSALAQAVDSATEAESVRTPGELFADAAQLATAGRTASWLDQLVNDGHLTPDQRIALAVEDGATTLTGLLRRVELAGHDPQQVLTDAVDPALARRCPPDHQRPAHPHQRSGQPRPRRRHLRRVDAHRRRSAVADLPHHARPRRRRTPQRARSSGCRRAARLGGRGARRAAGAGSRRGSGRLGEARRIRGRLPRAGRPRRRVGPARSSRPSPARSRPTPPGESAWRALGRPEADRAEAEMSTGQLRVRIRAYEREKAWAPDYVADQLAGTRQAADKHRHDATLWDAQAAATTEHDTAARLRDEAAKSAALAQGARRPRLPAGRGRRGARGLVRPHR